MGNNDDIIDRFQRRQSLGAKGVIKKRPAGAFVDVGGGGQGDHQNIPQLLRLLEMNHVPGMNQIKRPVALHDGFSFFAESGKNCRGPVVAEYFVAHGLWM